MLHFWLSTYFIFDYPRYLRFDYTRNLRFDYPRNLQMSEPEDLVMLHVHGGGFISQVKLVADIISTHNWDVYFHLYLYLYFFICICADASFWIKNPFVFQTSKSHLDYLHQWAIKLNVSKVFPNNKYNLYIIIIQIKTHFHKYILFISSLSMRTLKVFNPIFKKTEIWSQNLCLKNNLLSNGRKVFKLSELSK